MIGAAEFLAAKTRGRAPTAAVFQVTDRCHLRCVHCYETHDTKGELTLGEIDRILGELAALGTMFLTLTGGSSFFAATRTTSCGWRAVTSSPSSC